MQKPAVVLVGSVEKSDPRDHDFETDRILGRIDYGPLEGAPRVVDGVLELPLAMLANEDSTVHETWIACNEVVVETSDNIAFSYDGETLLCVGFIPGQDLLADVVQALYEQALTRASELGYTSVYRMWNAIGRINDRNSEGLEVYRDFCVGRARAFEAVGVDSDRMPAATGIGSRGSGVSFYFLAARSGEVVNIENPRQMPAYDYPRAYGPKSPSFARASTFAGSDTLFISGTASILGHRTVQIGDLDGQLETTRDNIRALLQNEPDKEPWQLSHVKVYVRHRNDLPRVRAFVEEHLPSFRPAYYFTVAICRDDLLLEIEGIATR
jgi:FkbO/Hyg5 family chorismatase